MQQEQRKYTYISTFIFSILFILGLSILSILFGASDISFRDILAAIFQFDADQSSHIILHELRIPRALALILVGAALGVSGGMMQGITQNALASPSLLGISAGASFFVALTYSIFNQPSFYLIIGAALIGAALGTLFVFGLSSISRGGEKQIKLVLAGSAISALLSSLSTTLSIKFGIAKNLSYWFVGGVHGIQKMHLRIAIPFILGGLILAMFLSKSISILSLGDEVAKGLGQNTTRVRLLSILAILLMTGTAVSISGMIGFVGLVIPHIVRMLFSSDYKIILPFSATFGAILLLAADTLGRLVNKPFETPVGVITAIIGLPFFMYLARKEGGKF